MRTQDLLDTAVGRVERANSLDRLADGLAKVIGKLIPAGPVEDTLSGTPVAHPVHPAVVAVPIGAWLAVPVLDAFGEDSAARRMTALGCIAAAPAAATGAADWLTTQGAERRVGLVHALANYTGLAVQALSWQARRRGRRGTGIALSLAGSGLLGAAGWLGGHLAYAQGVGVDTTVFQHLPAEWTDAAAESEVPPEGAVTGVEVAGVPILLARRSGDVVAMAARCTHRGGPLPDGEVRDGCVTCPWHGSSFSLDDGTVRSGPATRPQPTLETRIRDGRVEVRRSEERTLRTNPVGV